MKKIISVLVCLAVVFGCCAFAFTAHAEDYKTGDIIEFGTYPQSEVKDAGLIETLNNLDGDWVSYGYYSGTGDWTDGQMTSSDYMRYKDISYDGSKYRGVTFDSYRPYYTGLTSSDNEQSSNGYNTGTTYWFKYEPLKWRVLDPSTGLIMCNSIIDSQPYNNYVISNGTDGHGENADWGDPAQTYYASNWAKSSLRAWLNNDFYNTAFSGEQKSNILTSINSNKCNATLTGNSGYEEYDSADTQDKVFLLSYDEVTNSEFGFSSSNTDSNGNRMLQGSDYAKCQGLWVENLSDDPRYGNSNWWQRTPFSYSYHACTVCDDGYAAEDGFAYNTSFGVCPALKIQNLDSDTVAVSTDSDGGNGNATDKSFIIIIASVAAAVLALIVILAVVLLKKKKKTKAKTPQAVNPPAMQAPNVNTDNNSYTPPRQNYAAPPQSAFCTACGSPLANGMRFCAKCGAPVQPATPSAPASAAPVAPPAENLIKYTCTDTGHGGMCAMCKTEYGKLYSVAATKNGKTQSFDLCQTCAAKAVEQFKSANGQKNG